MPAALPFRALHHIARVTRRPEQSKAFYCDILGFRELARPPFAFRGAWLYNYGVQIPIIENPERVLQICFRDPDGHHIEIAVYGDPSMGCVAPAGDEAKT